MIVRVVLTYGCEAWTTTSVTERRLTTLENKIWRMICGSKLGENTGMWRRKFNKELIEETGMTPVKYYIRGQRIQ
jgi:transcriptional regulator GlxA family with amidase domain